MKQKMNKPNQQQSNLPSFTYVTSTVWIICWNEDSEKKRHIQYFCKQCSHSITGKVFVWWFLWLNTSWDVCSLWGWFYSYNEMKYIYWIHFDTSINCSLHGISMNVKHMLSVNIVHFEYFIDYLIQTWLALHFNISGYLLI